MVKRLIGNNRRVDLPRRLPGIEITPHGNDEFLDALRSCLHAAPTKHFGVDIHAFDHEVAPTCQSKAFGKTNLGIAVATSNTQDPVWPCAAVHRLKELADKEIVVRTETE